MVNCLMDNPGEVNKADWSSAIVMLGLTPTILGGLSPTLEQKAKMCWENPILGFLCVLGAPSSPFSRPWERLDKVPSRHFGSRALLPKHSASLAAITLKYLLASAAAANVLQNAIMLGQQTILSWKCTWAYLEIAWVFLALVPLLFAIGSVYFEGIHAGKQNRQSGILDSLANILAAGHVVFGTVVLSAVLFIGTLDALGVFARFAASALICQLITVLDSDENEVVREMPLPLQQANHTVVDGRRWNK
ncbi:hypothetical protein N7541_006257 [Penicillium brevicompactum]|uniref:Uncharacterized protein n=1 Tax=Penicillium brevicompactum TaxID=5074 RepID=A0A9W9UQD5_PENBR|nr:hypothetical protein N7541_006257 [Penicillium brevicompactum]